LIVFRIWNDWDFILDANFLVCAKVFLITILIKIKKERIV